VTPEPGACSDPECPVLHADPANPIHPPSYVPSNAMHPATEDEFIQAAVPLEEHLERLAQKLSEALQIEFNFLPWGSLEASQEAWIKVARGLLIKLGAEAHMHFEEHDAPSMLTYTFAHVLKHDPATGKVLP
jgi:hypothetical protein